MGIKQWESSLYTHKNNENLVLTELAPAMSVPGC